MLAAKVNKKKPAKFALKNVGLGVLHGALYTTYVPTPFSVAGAGKFTLAPGKTHEATIAFAPRAAGGVAGYREVISEDSASRGLPVQIAVDGTADQLSAGSRSAQAVRFQRSASRGLLIASAACGGARRRECLLNGVILVILTHGSATSSTFPGFRVRSSVQQARG